MGTELVRHCVKQEDNMQILATPPGYESSIAPLTVVKVETNGVMIDNSPSMDSKLHGVQVETDSEGTEDGNIMKSLRRKSPEDESDSDDQDPSVSSSLPKGVIRGCEACPNCLRVTARWRPEDARRPDLDDAPVFYPAEEEFEDTLAYIASILVKAEAYGICRIVPPTSWKPPCPLKEKNIWENSKFATRVQRIDRLHNRDSMRKMWKANQHKKKKRRRCSKTGVDMGNGSVDIRIPGDAATVEGDWFGFDNGPEFTVDAFQRYADDFKAQYFRQNEGYSEPSLENIEGEYWRIVEKPTEEIEVLHGTDMETGVFGSGFPMHGHQVGSSDIKYVNSGWNLNNFPRLPGSVLTYESSDISGFLVPWLSIGMCFSSFCWHVEDHHLYSLNYMHWGDPKMWYCVPGAGALKLEAAMGKHSSYLFDEQPDLLHKLVTQLCPSILKSEGKPVYRCVQNPGEFVLTFPRAYHAGFSCGFNCMETVNVPSVDCLPHGQNALELYREQGRKNKNTSDNLQWADVCGKDGILSKASKNHVDMERVKGQLSCNSSQALRVESTFAASNETEHGVRSFDQQLLVAGCRYCSPDKYACSNHAKEPCTGESFNIKSSENSMTTLAVFIQHSGQWDNNRFVNFAVDGVVINTGINFEDFIATISKQLGVDTTINLMEIKYMINEVLPPMVIHNDMGVRVYVELKKKASVTMYPLCITWKEKVAVGSFSNINPVVTSSDGKTLKEKAIAWRSSNVNPVATSSGCKTLKEKAIAGSCSSMNPVATSSDCKKLKEKAITGSCSNVKSVATSSDCIALKEKVIAESCSNVNSVVTSSVCLQSINVAEIYNPDVIDMIGTWSGEDYEDYVGIEFDEIGIIGDPLHQDVFEGQFYKDKETIISVMKHYMLREKCQFKVTRSCSTRYCIKCVDDSCEWNFKSSSLNTSKIFKVRKFNDVHTCSMEERFAQGQTSSVVIGSIIKEKCADHRTSYTLKEIMQDMKKDYGVDLNYMKAWRSKEKALQLLRGNLSESYGKLPSYLYMLVHTNPGSVVRLQKSDDGCFMYAFVSLYASIKGWEYCRPVVVVDGSFLNSVYGETLITACTEDASGKILPLAYALVDSENDASWEWFFEQFRDAFGEREGMCIVSDVHESILNAISVVYPEVSHCFCVWHMWNNIRERYKMNHQLRELFFTIAKAYTIEEFDHYMVEMDKVDQRVNEYLFNIGYHMWSRAHSTVSGTMTITSNIAELMNVVNKDPRELPILPLLEYMRKLVEVNLRFAMKTSTKLGEKYDTILKENLKLSKRMTVKPSTDYLYTVIDGERRNAVCLRERTCSCRKFQLDELPCSHALAVLKYNDMDEDEYCSAYYSRDYLLKTYEYPVYPLPDESTWNIPMDVLEEVVLPPWGPKTSGRVGRPKKFKPSTEMQAKKTKLSCGLCEREGHNRKTCMNLPRV